MKRTFLTVAFRGSLVAAGLSFAATSQGAIFTFSLDDPHKTVPLGTTSVWFNGTIDVLQENDGATLWAVHTYLDGTYANKLDVNQYAQSYYNWLGSGASFHAGGHYTGPLFELAIDASDPEGLYSHSAYGLTDTCRAYVYESLQNTPDHRSNEVEYSVRIVPEPATLTALALGALAMMRRRRR